MTRETKPNFEHEVEGDDHLPDDMPPSRSWTDSNDWRAMAMKLLLGGGLLAILLAYTDAIKDYTRTGAAVSSMQALMAEHARILSDVETDRREQAVLRREYDQHIREQSEAHIRIDKKQDEHDKELREIEKEMREIARKLRP